MSNWVGRLLEPKRSVAAEHKLFSDAMLKALIVPLVIEQILAMTVGMADTLMISYAGEAAISGVSLVDMINGVLIYLFSALATGGAIVVSQYIGNQNMARGRRAASQLFMASVLLSLALMAGVLAGNRPLLGLLFGRVEPDVMGAALTYLIISAFSYPFIAAYNACAALFRSMGNSKAPMLVSLAMNVLNVAGNAIGIFALHAGVAGVAVASLISRAAAAAVMFAMLLNEKRPICLRIREIFAWDGPLLGQILRIAVPNGVENGVFHLCRVIQTSIIALFGTAQIAANGVANSLDMINNIFITAISLAMPAVVGRCVGAMDYEQAEYYIRKLMRVSVFGSLAVSALMVVTLPLTLRLYSLSAETMRYVYILVVIHALFTITVSPFSGSLSAAIRATGDVKSMMIASMISVAARTLFSFVFGVWMNGGIIGIWLAMVLQWCIQAAFSVARFRGGKWRQFRAIRD